MRLCFPFAQVFKEDKKDQVMELFELLDWVGVIVFALAVWTLVGYLIDEFTSLKDE